jgi:hypothetical protein
LAIVDEIAHALSGVSGGSAPGPIVSYDSSTIIRGIISTLTPVITQFLLFFFAMIFWMLYANDVKQGISRLFAGDRAGRLARTMWGPLGAFLAVPLLIRRRREQTSFLLRAGSRRVGCGKKSRTSLSNLHAKKCLTRHVHRQSLHVHFEGRWQSSKRNGENHGGKKDNRTQDVAHGAQHWTQDGAHRAQHRTQDGAHRAQGGTHDPQGGTEGGSHRTQDRTEGGSDGTQDRTESRARPQGCARAYARRLAVRATGWIRYLDVLRSAGRSREREPACPPFVSR